MSFALCLYYAEDRRQLVEYPKALLFDEIDAPLHPSMTQSLLRTVQEVLISRHDIKVILTTHSPSTAALSEEGSLYAMFKTGDRIRKTTKDNALSILTAGVPTLSIHYENRRQVFVEHQYDVGYYEPLYEKVRSALVPDISLTFIASGKSGQGSCEQVKDVVNRLYGGGNQTVYGIIDWDLTHTGNERVKVLGRDLRYSIENYILDPILVAAFLLREKFVARSDLAMSDSSTYLDLARSSNPELQKIAQFVLDKLKPHVATPLDGTQVSCSLFGGGQIELPVWFLRAQGHQLEAALKSAFPPLGRFTKENELKKAVVTKVVDDLPGLISIDFVALFRSIQNYTAAS